MNKIWTIALREIKVKIRTKTFKIMTVMGPMFFAFILIVPYWMNSPKSETEKKIYVLDQANIFSKESNFSSSEHQFEFNFGSEPLDIAKIKYLQGNYIALVHTSYMRKDSSANIDLYSKQMLSLSDKISLEKSLKQANEFYNLTHLKNSYNLDVKLINTPLNFKYQSISNEYDKPVGEAAGAIGLFLSILIYFFILLYGLQVMRSIMEEKNTRIVEVLLSAIKPFELMMGKILGIAVLSILQFFIWVISTTSIALLIRNHYSKSLELFDNSNVQKSISSGLDFNQSLEINSFINSFNGIHPASILLLFFVFFIGGYLLYSAMFAAIGSIVDNETDVQQFMLPVTLPLFISFMFISAIMEEPNGNVAFWLSIFPLTSPVIMMVRIPYGVPFTELLVSVSAMIFSFLITTYGAAKIYSTGILMHGKKIGYGQIFKFLMNKNR